VISRCQQLHLHRVKLHILAKHLKDIAEQEGYCAEQSVYEVLAQYSEGGVRDALSLMERVLLVSSPQSPITLDDVLSVLGLAPRPWLDQWFECLHHGDGAGMVDLIRTQYHQGSEPITLLSQLMQLIHEKTTLCLKSPEHNNPPQHSPIALDRYDQWWQLGQKGLSEVSASPFPLLALEMVALRMAYMTHFPTQSQILSLIEPSGHQSSSGGSSPWDSGASARKTTQSKGTSHHPKAEAQSLNLYAPPDSSHHETTDGSGPRDDKKRTTAPLFVRNKSSIVSIDDLLMALAEAREGLLHAHVRSNVSWVGWSDTALVLHWDKTRGEIPKTFAASFDQFFKNHMEKGCHIQWHDTALGMSQLAQEEQEKDYYDALAKQNPGVQTILKTFPDATIEQITRL
jgi:DNA polymerase-3 subunit gamma/tau